MGNRTMSPESRDQLIQLSATISTLRRIRGLSQAEFAEKANVSRALISVIEAPGIAKSFNLDIFFDIARALEVDPADLINGADFIDKITRKKKM